MRPVTGRAVISHDFQKPEARSGTQEQVCDGCLLRRYCIAVFTILADVVKVKKGSGSTVNRLYPAEWMAQTLFHTVDHPGQNWEDSNTTHYTVGAF